MQTITLVSIFTALLFVTAVTDAQNTTIISQDDSLIWFKIWINKLEKSLNVLITSVFENRKIYDDNKVENINNMNTTNVTTISEHNKGNAEIIDETKRLNASYTLLGVQDNEDNVVDDSKVLNKLNVLRSESDQDTIKCTEANERYPILNSCDSYTECQNGKAEKKLCPDGLRYNPNVKANLNPCQFPAEVACKEGSTLQPPKPTQNCPNQYGYFKIQDRFNCSWFRICEQGVAYDYKCPEGLAFNSATYRCDWPDKVPECDVDAFLGYSCPQVLDLAIVPRKARSTHNCEVYFSCINGKPRRLECDDYFGFNELTQTCVPAYELKECTEQQRFTAYRLVKKTSNGTYIVLDDNDYESYDRSRIVSLRLTPSNKHKAKVIKNILP